ncbi:CAP domain-containing protein [Corynebacterium aurimucosum]|nr:CAP domain-containing protein [Corynebacterium aurimucosum]NJJ82194.1 CAP domain-containing protein [Corynebacterium aurimucosum]
MNKPKKFIATIVASATIATATPATASAAPVQTPIGTIQVPDNLMQTFGPILAAIGGLGALAAIIGGITGGSNDSSSILSSLASKNTPAPQPQDPNTGNPGTGNSGNEQPTDPNITRFGGPKATSLSSAQIRELERQVFDEINAERQRRGRVPLDWSDNFYSSAKKSSTRMAREGNTHHTDFKSSEAAETIKSYPLDQIGKAAVNKWSGSAGHWNILMSDYAYYGAVSITPADDNTYVVVFQG